MLAESSGTFIRVPIRSIQVVVDMEDPLAPELTLEDFVETHRTTPTPPKYRMVNLEVLTCPEDQQPILASECGHCTRFVRRLDNVAYFRRENPIGNSGT